MWSRSHPMASSCLLRNPVTMTGVIHTSTVTYPLKAASIMPGSNRTPPYHHREDFGSTKQRTLCNGWAGVDSNHARHAGLTEGFSRVSLMATLYHRYCPFAVPILADRSGCNNLKTIFTLCNCQIKNKDCNKLCKTFICLTVPANSSRMGGNDSSGKFIIKPCTIADEAGIGPARSQGSCGNIAKKPHA